MDSNLSLHKSFFGVCSKRSCACRGEESLLNSTLAHQQAKLSFCGKKLKSIQEVTEINSQEVYTFADGLFLFIFIYLLIYLLIYLFIYFFKSWSVSVGELKQVSKIVQSIFHRVISLFYWHSDFHGAYPASRGPSIFLDKSGRGRDLCQPPRLSLICRSST